MRLIAALLVGLGLVVAAASPAMADTINWTDFTSATTGVGGSATGTMTLNGNPVTVTYSGPLSFAELSGSEFWTAFSPAPYTSATVDNGPLDGVDDLLALNLAGDHTLTFSQPVANPVMAILSLGRTSEQYAVSYDFGSTAFTVLSEGKGHWGDGTYTHVGNVLKGYELHGVIQFSGLISSISWTSSPGEDWHGIQIGAASPVPEPGTLALLGLGLAGLGLARRRRRKPIAS